MPLLPCPVTGAIPYLDWVKPSFRFYRNLGDVSVIFGCRPVTVKPIVPDEKICYIQPPVDFAGSVKFLDPATRVLLPTGTETRCSLSTAPILQLVDGSYAAFTPHLQKVDPEFSPDDDDTSDDHQHGIYSAEVVQDWLDSAYLAHIYQTLTVAGGDSVTLGEMMRGVQESYSYVKSLNLGKFSWLGVDWDYIGQRASIILLFIYAIYMVYWVIETVLKFVMIYETEKRWIRSLFRSCFSHLHLMAEEAARKVGPRPDGVQAEDGTPKDGGCPAVAFKMEA